MALEYLVRRQVEVVAAASPWRPLGLGAGSCCSLNFRRGVGASMRAALTIRVRRRRGMRPPALAGHHCGGPHNLSICLSILAGPGK